jgi:hypothetical protein
VHFSFKALILRVLCTRKISALSPTFVKPAPLAKMGCSQGEQRGRQEGRQIVLRQLSRRVGVLSVEVRSQITRLSAEQLEALAEALLDFSGTEDLMAWLQAYC